jgi:hypothetical protein
MEGPKLIPVATVEPSGCDDVYGCPTVYDTDQDVVAVQGYQPTSGVLTQVTLPDGETLTLLPRELFLRAAREMERARGH